MATTLLSSSLERETTPTLKQFMKAYQNEFGFTLETKVMADDVKVGVGAHLCARVLGV
jgi:glycerophosphoryl diester phosphodiesterase